MKAMKVWMIVAASLVAAGLLLVGGTLLAVMIPAEWDFTQLSTDPYETIQHDVTEDFRNISITGDTEDVVFVPSEDGRVSVVSHEQKNLRCRVEVRDGTLFIEWEDTRKWYEHVGISFGSSKVTVFLPQGEYGWFYLKSSTGDLEIPADFAFESMEIIHSTGDMTNRASVSGAMKITADTGDIRLESLSAASLDLSVSTGHITVSDVSCAGAVSIRVTTGKSNLTDLTCQSLTSSGDTGDLTMTNVLIAQSLSVVRDTGDVRFNGCDAAELDVKTSTGDVSGTLLSDKIFLCSSSTGDIKVPETLTGGKCKVETSTGDIRLTVTK